MAVINGTSLGESLNGTEDPDVINGFGGNDVIHGNGGDDVIDGGAGGDELHGGIGADRFVIAQTSDSPTSLIDSDYIVDFEAETDTLDLTAITGANSLIRYFGGSLLYIDQDGDGAYDSIVRVIGMHGADVLTNMTSGFLFDGYGEMWGTAGNDTMLGWDSNRHDNLFYGGLGGDFMDGGSDTIYDDDMFLYLASAESSLANPDTIVFDSADGAVGGDLLDLSYLESSGGRIVISDDAANNSYVYLDDTDDGSYEGFIISHGLVRGFDIVGSTQITYIGTSADDSFGGGAGNDIIAGYDGVDTLKGGGGADMLYGGAGSDTFVYRSVNDTLLSAYDVIFDFESGVDTLDLTGIYNTGVYISHFAGSSFIYLDSGFDNTADAVLIVQDELVAYSDVRSWYTLPAEQFSDSLVV